MAETSKEFNGNKPLNEITSRFESGPDRLQYARDLIGDVELAVRTLFPDHVEHEILSTETMMTELDTLRADGQPLWQLDTAISCSCGQPLCFRGKVGL